MSLQALAGAGAATLPGATTAPPAVDQALEPASVRHGSAATQKAYQSALAFEQVLVEQLAKSLTASAGVGGEEEGESSEGGAGAESSQLSSTLPQALSAGVMNAGGLGMAAQMAQQMQAHSGETQTAGPAAAVSPSSGGTEASAVAGAAPSTGENAATRAAAVVSPASGGTGAP